jgi:beta-ribofuranosylaminobenzene 5'-phosphate synthase
LLELVTSCRLHFGLLELAADQPHRYGGLGLMIQAPQMRLRCDLGAHVMTCPVEVQTRIQHVVDREAARSGFRPPNNYWLDAIELVPMHSGLGVGTQLASAVATLLRLLARAPQTATAPEADVLSSGESPGLEPGCAHGIAGSVAEVWQADASQEPGASHLESIAELAMAAGRGKRSSIGLQGFLSGGLIRDLGFTPNAESTSLLGGRGFSTSQVDFPQDWPVVILLSTESSDMYGETEEQLITSAGAHPNPDRLAMLELSACCMAAARARDLEQFVTSLEKYMDYAAALFAPVQAGRYRTDRIRQRVEAASAVGLRGCGQSSWGPTVFGFAADMQQAQTAAAKLRQQFCDQAVRVLVTTAADKGAQWRWISPRTKHAS